MWRTVFSSTGAAAAGPARRHDTIAARTPRAIRGALTSSRTRPRRRARGERSRALRQQHVDVALQHIVGDRADVLEAHAAGAVDKERLGDAVDAVVHRHAARRIGRGGQAVVELGEELLGGFVLVLDVDPDERDAAVFVGAPAALEGGRLLVATGEAPRGPEVHDDDAAAESLQRQLRPVEALEGAGRAALAGDRRGDLARVSATTEG